MTPVRFVSHLLFVVSALLAGSGAWAQDVSFSATANPQKIGLKDALQVTYTLENVADLQSLEPASSKDFSIIGGPMDGQSSSTSIVNGKRTQTSSFSRTYILQARRTGTLRAPEGVARTAGGAVYRSNAPVVEVVKGSVVPAQRQRPVQDPFFSDPFFQSPFGSPPPPPEPPTKKIWNPEPGRDLFIRASVNKPQAYVGEAVVVSYRLYSRVTVQAALSNVPQAAGAWTEEIPIGTPSPTDETVNGQSYRAVLIKQLLIYPQQVGTLILPPAEAEGYAQPPGDAFASAGSFFGDPALGAAPVRLRTGAVSLKVLPLPETGRPLQFGGAVGTLSLRASLDKTSTTTDAGASLTLTMQGAGAGRLTPVPRPFFPPGVDAYEPVVHDSVLADGTGIKTVRYALAMREAGDFSIPSISLHFFDPVAGVYRMSATQPLRLRVAAGGGAKGGVARAGGKTSSPAWLSKGFAILGLALATGAAAYFFVRKTGGVTVPPAAASVAATAAPATRSIATQGVVSALAVPESAALESAANHADLLRIFRQHLAEMLGLPGTAVAKGAVLRALDAEGVSPELQEKVHRVWQQCEAAVYAPGSIGTEQPLHQTAQDAAATLDQLRLRPAA